MSRFETASPDELIEDLRRVKLAAENDAPPGHRVGIAKFIPSQCSTVARRIEHDRRKGKTTSQATVDFIRRTCLCDLCDQWRRAAR